MSMFPKIIKQQLMDWIRKCHVEGTAMPSDANIMERFGLFTQEAARSILAELADEGGISIKWANGERAIKLGRKELALTRAPALPATPKKRGTSLDDGTDKIMAIIGRKTRAVEIAREVDAEAQTTSKRRLQAAQSGTTIRSVDTHPGPLPPPTPAKIAPQIIPKIIPAAEPDMVRLPTAPGKEAATRLTRRQVNAHLNEADFLELSRRAQEQGVAASALARDMLSRALTLHTEQPTPLRKPRVSAAVMAALRDDGREFGEFLTYLIGLGLNCHNDALMAEAAE